MKYAHIDENNNILGWYDSDIHVIIPEPSVQVSDEQWQLAINENHNIVNLNGITEFIDSRTAEQIAATERELHNRIHKGYLSDTDWYVVRQLETGKPIPQDILDARQVARDSII